MLDRFNSFIDKHKLCRKNDRLVLAVSGGVDSVVMAHLCYKSGFQMTLAHCNFKLRGKDADEDEKFVLSLGEKYGVEVFTNSFSTQTYAENKKVSVQVAARQLRYQWFYGLLKSGKGDLLATAHHLDDQLETLIYNLTKGVGIMGMAGIPLKDQQIIRPMLFASRDEVLAYAGQENLRWREDSSNQSSKYRRNFIRHEIVPRLREINPSISATVARTSKRLREGVEIIEAQVNTFRDQNFKSEGPHILVSKESLNGKGATFLELLLKPYGINYAQAEDIEESLSGTGTLFPTDSYQLNIDRENLIISPLVNLTSDFSIPEHTTGKTGDFQISVMPKNEFGLEKNPSIALLDYDKLCFPLTIRKWQEGDKFVPLGMRGQKKLSDFMIDSKIALNLKDRIMVLKSGNDIVWVVGHRIDDRYKVTSSTRSVYKIEWLK